MATEQLTTAGPRVRVHLKRILIGALVIIVIGAGATLFGWDVSGWLKHVWNTITSISIGYLLAALALITLQTTTTAYAWYAILGFAYGRSNVRWLEILACYATAVALNGVLPASLGTLVMLVMFSTIIAGATFAGILAGFVVQKMFYTVIGTLCYVYLFVTVGGSFSLQLGFAGEHPGATAIFLVGVAVILFLVARALRERVRHWWQQAQVGGRILVHPRAYLGRVLFPEVISWVAMLGIIAVFLTAYDIPVSFHTLIRVVAGNSIANITAVTPGGAGVVQGFNVLSLKGITSSANATAYSVSQQLVTTSWDILFAIVLLAWTFGWSGGRSLVTKSYSEARERAAAESAVRKAKKQARRQHPRKHEDVGA